MQFSASKIKKKTPLNIFSLCYVLQVFTQVGDFIFILDTDF